MRVPQKLFKKWKIEILILAPILAIKLRAPHNGEERIQSVWVICKSRKILGMDGQITN